VTETPAPDSEGQQALHIDADRVEIPDPGAPAEYGLTVSGGGDAELPHWTDPPTGQIPRIRPEGSAAEDPTEDELSAWQALGSRGLHWRDKHGSDWDDLEDMGALEDDATPLGALDTTRSEHSDMFSFDEQFERLEEERSGQYPAVDPDAEAPSASVGATGTAARGSHRSGGRGRPPGRPGRSPIGGTRGGGRDMPSAVAVGGGLLVLLIIAYFVGPILLLILAAAVVTACALELFNLMQHRGFRPATLLGLCATVAVMFATYWRGEQAIPLVLVLVFVTSMLWYMMGVVEARPVVNVAMTVMAFVWVGVFGSYASLLLRVHHGKGLFMLPVLVTAVADIVAYLVGSTFGSRPLARTVSPGKTWEGTVAGAGAAIVAALIIGKVFLSNTWTLKHALLLGIVVAIFAPIGDLCESMVKRDLHTKDSGTILPGHGGLLDRFDALLFVLPATYYLAQYLRLLR
jgi:phosphatidate cytidylyltransferase